MSDRFETLNAARRPGQRVRIGERGEILATIEEVIFARGQLSPFYLVEWWHDGQLIVRRFHEDDLREVEPHPAPQPGGIIWRQGRPD